MPPWYPEAKRAWQRIADRDPRRAKVRDDFTAASGKEEGLAAEERGSHKAGISLCMVQRTSGKDA